MGMGGRGGGRARACVFLACVVHNLQVTSKKKSSDSQTYYQDSQNNDISPYHTGSRHKFNTSPRSVASLSASVASHKRHFLFSQITPHFAQSLTMSGRTARACVSAREHRQTLRTGRSRRSSTRPATSMSSSAASQPAWRHRANDAPLTRCACRSRWIRRIVLTLLYLDWLALLVVRLV